MAEVHLLRRDLPAALELYDGLTHDYPDSPKLHNERGVCLHQAGRRDDAEKAYRAAVELDRNYALAWNNLGVLHSNVAGLDDAIDAFQSALRARHGFVTTQLNLGLILLQRKRLQLALEAYRQVLGELPNHPVAWNGVGLVLTELRRYQDARNAFSRAVEGDPENASAHYNLSFTLSQLGEFDLALRETKRALELEPFYVPQKYRLAIDLQYEDPTIAIVPDISGDVATEEVGEEFSFDQRLLDQVFRELSPARDTPPPPSVGEDPLALAREFLQKGLLEKASSEMDRAVDRGADPARAGVVAAHIFSRRGLHGEAVERYRQARLALEGDDEAALGEVRSLLALDRADEATGLAEELLNRLRDDVDALMAVARVRLAAGNPVGALDLVKEAQLRAPGRPDLLQLQARIAVHLGDIDGAVDAYHAVLQLDGALAQAWWELGGLEERRENWTAARVCYDRAVDILPTYVEAALSLADLLRRVESPAAALDVLVSLLTHEPYELDALGLLGRTLPGRRPAGAGAGGVYPRPEVRAERRLRALLRRGRPHPPAALPARRAAVGAGDSGGTVIVLCAAGPERHPVGPGPRAYPDESGIVTMAIEGPLKELGIHDVFQLLDLSRKTGILRVRSEIRQNAGTVYFERGAVVGAEIRSNPHPLGGLLLRAGKLAEEDLARARAMQQNGDSRRLGEIFVAIGAIGQRELDRQVRAQLEEVVFELLSWAEGYFSFEEGDVSETPAEAPVRIPTEALVMEAARRIDEWSRIEKRIPHLGIIPRLSPMGRRGRWT